MSLELGINKLSYQGTNYDVILKKASGEALKSDQLSYATWWVAKETAESLNLPVRRIGDRIIQTEFEHMKQGMTRDFSNPDESWQHIQWKHFLEENAVRTVYYNTKTGDLEFKNAECESQQIAVGYVTLSRSDLFDNLSDLQSKLFKDALGIRNTYFRNEFVSMEVVCGNISYAYETPFANLSDPSLIEAIAAGISEIQSKQTQLELFAESELDVTAVALPSLIQRATPKKSTLRM